jgi:hypothetical protein
MFRVVKAALTLAAVCILISAAWADSLELKNGSVIKGRYLGGSRDDISFQVGSSVQHYPVSDIVSLRFERDRDHADNWDNHASSEVNRDEPQRPDDMAPQLMSRSDQTTPPADPASYQGSVTVPSGTQIKIRMIDSVDSNHNQVGDAFKASLEQAIVVNDQTVVPKGADVYGKLEQATEAGHIAGRSQLKLALTGVVINGQTIPITTGDYSVTGKSRGVSTAERVGGGAALGALIGGIAGGGGGAALGAGIGAGAGTAVQVMTKGEQVHVPSETLLEFQLQQDATMPVAN